LPTKKQLYSNVVKNWAQYIDGQGDRPKKPYYDRSQVSSFGNSTVKCKPTINCSINGLKKEVLVDTGADCNVIDYEFFKKVAKHDPSIKIIKSRGNLTCANSSPLQLVGYSNLDINIGKSIFHCKFLIVEKIVPHVIIGLKMMKKNKISVNPAKSCINIGLDETIFFLSVSRETIQQVVSKVPLKNGLINK